MLKLFIFLLKYFIITYVIKKHKRKYMKLSSFLLEKIIKDNQLSLKIALILDIQQVSVRALARNGSEKLAHAKLVNFYKNEGFPEEQIWEK